MSTPKSAQDQPEKDSFMSRAATMDSSDDDCSTTPSSVDNKNTPKESDNDSQENQKDVPSKINRATMIFALCAAVNSVNVSDGRNPAKLCFRFCVSLVSGCLLLNGMNS